MGYEIRTIIYDCGKVDEYTTSSGGYDPEDESGMRKRHMEDCIACKYRNRP